MGNTQRWAHLALVGVSIIYALNYFIAKGVFAQIPPLAMVSLRSVAGSMAFLLIGKLLIRERIQSRADFARLLLCGLLGATLNQVFFFLGLSRTFEVNASVLMTTTPVFVFLIAFAMRSERLSLRKIIGLILAFGGAIMLSLGGRQLDFNADTLSGDLMVMLNAASYGAYLVLVRPLLRRYHPFTVVMWVMLFGAICNVPLGLPDLLVVDWSNLSQASWYAVLYILLLTTIATYALNAFALQRLPASAVGIYIYLQPVFVAILAPFLANHLLSLEKLAYMSLVLGGVFLVSYAKKTI